MNHGDMDHGGHGGMDMGPKCSMNMLWNTQIIDTCVVFPWWHISSTPSFVLSFLIIVLLGVGYEFLRELQRGVDRRIAASLKSKAREGSRTRDRDGELVSASSTEEEQAFQEEGLLSGRRVSKAGAASGIRLPPTARIVRAIFYGASVFLSFFLMLVFMTYNAYLILAVVLGAAIGHYIFGTHLDIGSKADAKGMACH